MNLAKQYLNGLQSRMKELILELKEEGDDGDVGELEEAIKALHSVKGASKEDIEKLKAVYPLCPESLLDLLSLVDGTHFRDYDGIEVTTLILGSDVGDYPYYLESIHDILQTVKHAKDFRNTTSVMDIYGPELLLNHEDFDPRIDYTKPMGSWLHFSDCMNNGGTSQLYIDFNPVNGGKVGQVIRYLHDPDSYAVIADSFDEYLRKLIDNGYSFVESYVY